MKTLSDATLKSMTKAELIEQLRCAEHNYDVAQKFLYFFGIGNMK